MQLQAPQEYIDSFNDTAPAVLNNKRRELAGMWTQAHCCTVTLSHRCTVALLRAGMVRSMDEGVGNVTGALREMAMLDETLIIFSTDVRPKLTKFRLCIVRLAEIGTGRTPNFRLMGVEGGLSL